MAIYDDFTGFQFNGKHSSDLHITRVSGGNRYELPLTPPFQDKTAQVEDVDYTLYWKSSYKPLDLPVNIAFDELTEGDLRILRNVFDANTVGELIFDETPYKAYNAKIKSPIQLQYICFDEEYEVNGEIKTRRIYKGEGTISFVAYFPFAHNTIKWTEELYDEHDVLKPQFWNYEEWLEASKITSQVFDIDNNYTYDEDNDLTGDVVVYNAGDKDADFSLILGEGFDGFGGGTISYTTNFDTTQKQLVLSPITLKGDDVYIRLNSKTNLIEGLNNQKLPTGNIYNEYIIGGDWFKIKANPLTLGTRKQDCGSSFSFLTDYYSFDSIEYNFLYY